jgi:hypothetical protein
VLVGLRYAAILVAGSTSAFTRVVKDLRRSLYARAIGTGILLLPRAKK